MPKITTKNCKEFIINSIKASPELVFAYFPGDNPGERKQYFEKATNIKNWIRNRKFNPNLEKNKDAWFGKYVFSQLNMKHPFAAFQNLTS